MPQCHFIGGTATEHTARRMRSHIWGTYFLSDILSRHRCFIGQVNDILCYFNKLNCSVIIKLLKAYCNSRYGCELGHGIKLS